MKSSLSLFFWLGEWKKKLRVAPAVVTKPNVFLHPWSARSARPPALRPAQPEKCTFWPERPPNPKQPYIAKFSEQQTCLSLSLSLTCDSLYIFFRDRASRRTGAKSMQGKTPRFKVYERQIRSSTFLNCTQFVDRLPLML